jgi:hypothetical protein
MNPSVAPLAPILDLNTDLLLNWPPVDGLRRAWRAVTRTAKV